MSMYENPETLDFEARAMEYVAMHKFGGRRAQKIEKKFYPFDYAIIEGASRVVAFCEVKIRNTAYEKFKNLKIPATKLIMASQMFAVFGTPTILIVHYTDQLRYVWLHDYRRKNTALHMWGGDAGDIEPSVLIPITDMELIIAIGHRPLEKREQKVTIDL